MLRLDDWRQEKGRGTEELTRVQAEAREREMSEGERESAPSMNNADFGSTEHRGCARTSEPQLELEESTVQSIERNAGAGAGTGAAARRARARVDS